MSLKKTIGNYGESLAIRYLLVKGYNILDNHFSSRFGEIDIIAQKEGRIHFIEVKTRTSDYFGLPEEAMTKMKIKKLLITSRNYIYKKKIDTDNYQLDLIAIKIKRQDKKIRIKHYQALQMESK